MAKKELTLEQKIAGIAADITAEMDRWDYIRRKGCQDPFWPDGVNMNLIRNHILNDKRRLLELCPDNLPREYYLPTPPEVDKNYMAADGEYFKVRKKWIEEIGDKVNTKPLPAADQQTTLF
jgi:hypothetical protein